MLRHARANVWLLSSLMALPSLSSGWGKVWPSSLDRKTVATNVRLPFGRLHASVSTWSSSESTCFGLVYLRQNPTFSGTFWCLRLR
jgi:hypothetical protein